MAEGARIYLERVLPFDGESYIGVFNKPNGKGAYGTPCLDADAAMRAVNRYRSQPDSNVYVSLASQQSYEERQSAKGNTYHAARRQIEHYAKSKALYLDMDVKPGAYTDTQQALDALYTQVDNFGLPRPSMIVGSGSGGLHVYWVLDHLLDYFEWRTLAEGLVEWATVAGLHFDRSVTIDGVRILRVPGTFNNKPGVNKPVSIIYLEPDDVSLQEMHAAMAPYKRAGVADRVREAMGLADADVLGGNMFREASLRDIDAVGAKCPFVSNQLATGGVGRDNPQWSIALLIASFCQNPEDTAHRLSNGHPQYTEAETAKEIARRLNERAEVTHRVGFPSCQAVRDAGAPECQTCPFFQLETSPLKLADTIAMPAETLPEEVTEQVQQASNGSTVRPFRLPPGAKVNPNTNRIVTKVTDDDGNTEYKHVFRDVIYDAWVSNGIKDEKGLDFYFIVTIGGKLEQGRVPFDVAIGGQGRAKLAHQGLFMEEGRHAEVFMREWLQTLKLAKESVISGVPFGWSSLTDDFDEEKTVLGFSYAGRRYQPGGKIVNAPRPSEELVRQYYPVGSLDPWRDACKAVLADNMPDRAVLVASAFAAPLMRFTGEGGVAIGTFSPESGLGKSTALKVAQAVWGHPRRGMQGLDDTQNSIMAKMGELNSLPVYVDELKTAVDVNAFTNTIFRITSGKGKSRLSASAQQREAPTWDTLLTYASNESVLDTLRLNTKGTVAGAMRVFEFRTLIYRPKQSSVHVAQKISKLETNYGRAGELYAKYLGENSEQVQIALARGIEKLSKELASPQEERFWIAAIAITLLGAQIANNLDLAKFNIVLLKSFMVKELKRMRFERAGADNDLANLESLGSILSTFFADMRARRTIHTDNINVYAGKPRPIRLTEDPAKVERASVQIAYSDALVRVDEGELGKWLRDNRIPPHTVLDNLETFLGAKRGRGKIGAGSSLTTATVKIIDFDVRRPKIAALLAPICINPDKPNEVYR